MKKLYNFLSSSFFISFFLLGINFAKAQAPSASYTCATNLSFPRDTCGACILAFNNTSTGTYDYVRWTIEISQTGCNGPWTTYSSNTYTGASLNNSFSAIMLVGGYYRLCLKDSNMTTGQSSVFCQCIIHDFPTPTAAYTMSPQIGCSPFITNAIPSNPNTTPPYTFTWNFGLPGNASTIVTTSCNGVPSASCGNCLDTFSCMQSPYTRQTVFYIVKDANGCQAVSTQDSSFYPKAYCSPVCTLAVSNNSNTCVAPSTVTLTATPAGLTSYTWWVPNVPGPPPANSTNGPSAANSISATFNSYGCYNIKVAALKTVAPGVGCVDTTTLTNAVCLQGIQTIPPPTFSVSTSIVCCNLPFQVTFTGSTNPASSCGISAHFLAIPIAGSPSCADTVDLTPTPMVSMGGNPTTQFLSIPCQCLVPVTYKIVIKGDSVYNSCSGCGIHYVFTPINITVNPSPGAGISLAAGYLSSYCAPCHKFKFTANTYLQNLPGYTWEWHNNASCSPPTASITNTDTITFCGNGTAAVPTQDHIICLKVCQSAANGGCCSYAKDTVRLTKAYGAVTHKKYVACGLLCDTFVCSNHTDSLYQWIVWDSAGVSIHNQIGINAWKFPYCFTGFAHKDTCYNVMLVHRSYTVGGAYCFDTIKLIKEIRIGHKIKAKAKISQKNLCLKRVVPTASPNACLYLYPDSVMHIIASPTNHLSQCTTIGCGTYFTHPGSGYILASSTLCDSPKICFGDTGKYVGHFIVNDNGCIDTVLLADTLCINGLVASFIDSVHCTTQGTGATSKVTYKPSVKYYYCNGGLPATDSLKIHLWNNTIPVGSPGRDIFDTLVAPNKVPKRYLHDYGFGGATYYVCMSVYDKFHLICDTDTVCRNVVILPVTAVLDYDTLVNSHIIACKDISNTWGFTYQRSTPIGNIPHVIWKWGDGTKNDTTLSYHVTHKYDTCGIFHPLLFISNSSGSCKDSTNVTVVVHSLEDSSGGHDFVKVVRPAQGCTRCLVFSENVIACGTTLGTTVIHFGDGQSVTFNGNWAPFTHCYTAASSTFLISTTVTDASGLCSFTKSFTSPAMSGMIARISGLPDTALCVGTAITVQNVSYGYIYQQVWKLSHMADGCGGGVAPNTITQINYNLAPFNDTFNTIGYYYLNLSESNGYTDPVTGLPCVADTCVLIHVQNPTVNLSSLPDTFPCPGSIATIANLTTGAYDSISLLLHIPGGLTFTYTYTKSTTGIPSSVQIPLGYVGQYQLDWYVSSRQGCSDYQNKLFFVKGPRGKFHALTHHACLGDSIAFVDTTNSANGVLVNWDDNSGNDQYPLDSTGIYHFSHKFSTCGRKSVVAYISDGSCIYGITDTVNVDCPKANFYQVPNIKDFCGSASVHFYDSSLASNPYVHGASIVSYLWTLYDSSGNVVQTYNTQNPIVALNTPGHYSMKLKITSNWGCVDSIEKMQVINIHKYPVAQFTLTPDTVCINGCISFTPTSINPDTGALHHRWYFNWATNSMTSTQSNPVACYSLAGTYHTILIDTSMYGCVDTGNIKTVVVLPTVVAGFTIPHVNYCGNFATITFPNTSTPNNGVTYCWNFGDSLVNACQSTLSNPSHTFYLPTGITIDSFAIKLIVSNVLGCKDSITKKFYLYSQPQAGLTVIPQQACDTLKPSVIDASASNSPITAWDLTWGDTTVAHVTTFPSGLTHTYYPHDTFVITYIITNAVGCKDTATVQVINSPKPVACAGRDTLVCAQQPVTLGCAGQPQVGYFYNWISPAGIPNHNSSNPTIAASVSQDYVVYMRNIATGCSDRDTMRVNVIPLVVPIAGVDTGVCLGNSVTLFAHGGITYEWRDSSNIVISTDSVITVTPSSSTIYTVKICGRCDCATVPVNVQVFQLPVIYLNHDINGIAAGRPVTIPPIVTVGTGVINWYPDYNINCTNCATPIFSPDVNTTYHVAVTDGHGCVDSSYVTIHVLCDETNAIYVPNAFTPESKGAGGNNDRFYVQGTGLSQLNYLRIYDRWGGIVFSTEHIAINRPELGWDGNFNGKPMSSEVFMYQLEAQCANGNIFHISGSFTLIR